MDDVAQGIDPELRAEGLGVGLARDVRVGGTDALAPRGDGVHLAQDSHHDGAAAHELRGSAERGRALQVRVQLARARGRQALLRATDHVESVGLRGREDALGEPAANGVGLDEAHGLLHGVLTRAKVVAGGAGTSPSRARSCARDPADATEVRVGRLINGTLRADSQRREKRSHADFNRSDRPIMDQTRALELL